MIFVFLFFCFFFFLHLAVMIVSSVTQLVGQMSSAVQTVQTGIEGVKDRPKE